MTALTCALVALNLAVTVVYFVRKEWRDRRMSVREDEMWAVLEMVKAYYEGGRIQHKEADIAKSETVRAVESKAGELAAKIEEVPVKVAQVLKPDSAILKAPQGG